MLQFEKPIYKITDSVESNFYGRFELEPLERGFGTTIGNALRRVMLSSLPGAAISSVKIEGALHEFQTLEGVVEDVTTIILNLKKIVIKKHVEEMKVIHLNVTKEGPVTAGDIECDSDVEIINKDLVIANVAKGGKLVMEMTVTSGRGYVKSEENKKLLDIKKVGVGTVDVFHYLREITQRGLDHQVIMVRHKAICVNDSFVFFLSGCKVRKEHFTIGVTFENILLLISP